MAREERAKKIVTKDEDGEVCSGYMIQGLLFNLKVFVFKTSRKSLNCLEHGIAVIRFP